jgi:DNA-binding NarL/FixJ family response regulator
MIRVTLLDDHPAVRAGLDTILAAHRDLHLIGSAADEDQLRGLLQGTHPDVLILDRHHPGRDGLQICLQVCLAPDPPAIILYSATTSPVRAVAAAVAGANAVVEKSSPARTLIDAIRTVATDPRVAPPVPPSTIREAASRLNPSEHAILAMRIAGHSPAHIATTLGTPEHAVINRTKAILAELARPIATPPARALATTAA